MRFYELIAEAAPPTVGRKYQHIEDLVFTNGSNGGLHAIERLYHMNSEIGTVETKVDGSPVVYWGRDEHGTFSLMPKNAWDYIKRGKTTLDNGVSTVMKSPMDIESFITGTGNVTPEQMVQRKAYAKQVAGMWPYFEAASPPKGYIEGGILFFPGKPFSINKSEGSYDFTPNITTFHVPIESELGRRISQAKIMVGATGYYQTIGSSEEGRFDNADKLSTKDLIVQGTTYVQQAPNMDTRGLQRIKSFLESNGKLIDNYLTSFPAAGSILYKFYNEVKRSPLSGQQFSKWAQTNLSAKQAEKALGDPKGLDSTLRAVDMISSEKLNLIAELSKGTHGGMRQTKPEGYVQAHPGTTFKNDLPGQFIKTIDQTNWSPRKN